MNSGNPSSALGQSPAAPAGASGPGMTVVVYALVFVAWCLVLDRVARGELALWAGRLVFAAVSAWALHRALRDRESDAARLRAALVASGDRGVEPRGGSQGGNGRGESDRAVRHLAGQLLSAQDDERRRLARELHDTTAQDLTAISLGLARVQQLAPASSPAALREILEECVQMVEQSGRGVRTMSYLLHPPLLDEIGLAAALMEFVDGLARRSGMKVALDCAEDLERLDRRSEMALFRVAQEGVALAHRRGSTAPVRVRVFEERDWVVVEVTDEGVGREGSRKVANPLTEEEEGMVILGMRERVRQLGGDLDLERQAGRFTVRARVPETAATEAGGVT